MDTNEKRSAAAERIGRTPMPEQDPRVRARNFKEVPLGYTEEMARREASRCLHCKTPLCMSGCPVNVPIPEFLHLIAEGQFGDAAKKIKEKNAFPAICGRVCPQENQCEGKCILGKKFEPVAIGRCERFAADYEREHGLVSVPADRTPKNGKKVAVIGAGPGGLTVAGDLILLGYDVSIFEAFHQPGGVLMYGIPEFRLPKDIVRSEVHYLETLGVDIELNTLVGKTISVDELMNDEHFDAVYIGVGAGLPGFLHVEGEDLGGIYSANEYLTRSNLMKAYLFPEFDTPIVRGKNVCVIGGGNVAMDSARSAMRLGAESVKIIYRRSSAELPARAEEVHHAEQEGIEFHFLTNPTKFFGNEKKMVCRMQLQKMELGEPDASGRRSPIPIEGSEYMIDTDLVIIAAGAKANPVLTKNTNGLELNKRGYIVATETGRTSKPGVWAGGDIVTGAATVILAMGAGRKSALDIHQWLSSKDQSWN
ncbi:MAG: NADPH-dependent glutamate synthase [Planctomycetia bacterium]|nr:NADPH-dependent glutamate synthase [Planctomycetia bacterium]